MRKHERRNPVETGATQAISTDNVDKPQRIAGTLGLFRTREPFRIVIAPGLWRGVDVQVEPPVQAYQLRHFKTHREALAYAEELARVEGWPLRDHVTEPARLERYRGR
jgi:hypothetical protein